MNLSTYRAKRRFNETPEPEGGKGDKSVLRFCVQKHQASHLHFDFRLEIDGTLKSWAVPKGPSLNPGDKRLAMMVEDHPLDYRTFEGNIPEGNYGAGSVIVWDEGTYHARASEDHDESERLMAEGLEQGHITFVLDGHKLRGEFALIKLQRGQKNAWLLVKKQDEFASSDEELDQTSVLSGRSLDDVAAGVEAKKSKGKQSTKEAKKPKPAPTKAKKQAAPTSFVRPMLATLVEKPFDRKGWLFEVKWDGYRAIAEVKDGDVRLYSRNQKSFDAKFAPLIAPLSAIGHDVVLDGEVVALDEEGKSQFQLLQNYQKTGKGQLVYYVFDLLQLDGQDLRGRRLTERKKLLAGILKGKKEIRLSEHIKNDGLAFFDAVADKGLEGMIAKNGESTYQEGARNLDWLKIKTHMRQEAVIGGFTRPKGSRQGFGALVLGVYQDDELVYIGHTGGGFDGRGLTDLQAKFKPLHQAKCPFSTQPKTNTPAQWLKPSLVCEVKFQDWTEDGHMRQPIFLGLREDKDPTSVHREAELPVQAAIGKTAKTKAPKQVKEKKSVPAPATDGPKLTNLDKVFWPEEGITKGDLIEYYRSIADIILPYLKDRPESLNRHPNGITGQNFFQKDVGKSPPPEWVETVSIPLEGEDRSIIAPLCQNRETLLYMANLGCIEINPWNASVGHLDRPDYLIIDLDPEAIAFKYVVEAAVAVHKLLDKAGCANYCKTSGKTGLHIFVPLAAKYDMDQARQFAEVIANVIQKKLPETTSILRSPAARQGKVYLDFLQNRRGQTIAAAYSVRPHPGATVSTPLSWPEVTQRLDPARFTIKNTLKRIDKVGDLWEPVLGKGIDLQQCLTKLAKDQ